MSSRIEDYALSASRPRLTRLDNGVRRHDTATTDDGLPPGEGAFLPCSFWLADNLAVQGRTEESRVMFRRLLHLANDVGLPAEEYDPHAGRQVGILPHAFSHVSRIDTAFNPSHVSKPTEGRAATGLADVDADRAEREPAAKTK